MTSRPAPNAMRAMSNAILLASRPASVAWSAHWPSRPRTTPVVALGAPVRSQLAVHPLVLAQVGVVAALGTAAAPGLFSVRCLRGECCSRFRDALAGPFPPEVGYVSLYSRSDGIVDWRSCLDPCADEHVEVRASHCGMSVSADAYRAIAAALRGFGAADARWAQAA